MPKQSYRPTDEPQRLTGRIVRWMPDKGFGFIEANNVQYFFHRSAVRGGAEQLNGTEAVTFIAGTGQKGPRAEDVEVE